MADRAPRVLSDGEIIDIGSKRFRYIDTPHVPHGWDAGVMFEETTKTLLCGDLFTHVGNGPAIIENDIVEPSITTENLFHTPASGRPPDRRFVNWLPFSRKSWPPCMAHHLPVTGLRR
jgi:hypothetical protein